MKESEFIKHLKDALEIEDGVDFSVDTDLTSLSEFDSLAVLSIIALADEKFGKRLPGSLFKDITTVKSLMNLIGDECFE